MSFSLKQPRVLDKIDPALLRSLELLVEPEELLRDLNITPQNEHQWPLYETLAQIADVHLDDEWMILGRSSTVEAGDSQDNRQRGWHFDRQEIYSVADTIPTDFLIADEDVVQNFLKTLPVRSLYPQNDMGIAIAMTEAMNYMSDADLTNAGFEIWSAQPLEVVAARPLDIHRPTPNNEVTPMYRNFALIGRFVM